MDQFEEMAGMEDPEADQIDDGESWRQHHLIHAPMLGSPKFSNQEACVMRSQSVVFGNYAELSSRGKRN